MELSADYSPDKCFAAAAAGAAAAADAAAAAGVAGAPCCRCCVVRAPIRVLKTVRKEKRTEAKRRRSERP